MKYRQNRSYTYLLPLLFKGANIPTKYKALIKNSYIFNPQGNSEEGILYLETETNDDINLPEFERTLKKGNYLIGVRECTDSLVYKVRMSNIYFNEYQCYMTGKYSRFSNQAKDIILTFWTGYLSDSYATREFTVKIKQILYKEDALRKQLENQLKGRTGPIRISKHAELGDIINKESETLKSIELKEKSVHKPKN